MLKEILFPLQLFVRQCPPPYGSVRFDRSSVKLWIASLIFPHFSSRTSTLVLFWWRSGKYSFCWCRVPTLWLNHTTRYVELSQARHKHYKSSVHVLKCPHRWERLVCFDLFGQWLTGLFMSSWRFLFPTISQVWDGIAQPLYNHTNPVNPASYCQVRNSGGVTTSAVFGSVEDELKNSTFRDIMSDGHTQRRWLST